MMSRIGVAVLGLALFALREPASVLQGRGHDEIMSAYGFVTSLPTTFIISREGKLCAKHIGHLLVTGAATGVGPGLVPVIFTST
jgi:hypothetical protein